jgi:hypothetical protein
VCASTAAEHWGFLFMKIDYFSHDTKARSDSKLVSLTMKKGMEGLGVYWCIVEMLYENEGRIMRTECERIAFELRTHSDCINEVIYSHDLFNWDDEYFWSNSVLKRLETINTKSEKARQSAGKRWGNASAVRTQCDGNAIKEKESKEKENNIGDELPTEEPKPETKPKPKTEKFIKPTIEQINEYLKKHEIEIDAERFYFFYEAKGWMVGKNKMKDWKAAVRTWKKPEQTTTASKPIKATLNDD